MATQRKLSSSKRINAAARALVKSGWEVMAGKKHDHIKSPDGKHRFAVPRQPRCTHAEANWFADLKRAGVEVPA